MVMEDVKIKVTLLTNGGYGEGLDCAIGKVVTGTLVVPTGGLHVPHSELIRVGCEAEKVNRYTGTEGLYFYKEEFLEEGASLPEETVTITKAGLRAVLTDVLSDLEKDKNTVHCGVPDYQYLGLDELDEKADEIFTDLKNLM